MEVQTTERVTDAATLVFNQFSIVHRTILMLEHSQHRDKSREMAGPVESGLVVQTRTEETGFILHSLRTCLISKATRSAKVGVTREPRNKFYLVFMLNFYFMQSARKK